MHRRHLCWVEDPISTQTNWGGVGSVMYVMLLWKIFSCRWTCTWCSAGGSFLAVELKWLTENGNPWWVGCRPPNAQRISKPKGWRPILWIASLRGVGECLWALKALKDFWKSWKRSGEKKSSSDFFCTHVKTGFEQSSQEENHWNHCKYDVGLVIMHRDMCQIYHGCVWAVERARQNLPYGADFRPILIRDVLSWQRHSSAKVRFWHRPIFQKVGKLGTMTKIQSYCSFHLFKHESCPSRAQCSSC